MLIFIKVIYIILLKLDFKNILDRKLKMRYSSNNDLQNKN